MTQLISSLPKYSGGKGRRNGRQVWANSFWLAVFLFFCSLPKKPGFLIGALPSIAGFLGCLLDSYLGDDLSSGIARRQACPLLATVLLN